MPIAAGTEVYNADCPPVEARGLSLTEAERDTALDGNVRHIVEDVGGKEKLKANSNVIDLTGFQKQRLDEILNQELDIEDWRVGEAIAEAYLKEHSQCFFPWPDKWDERKNGSSLPGADLAGLQKTDNEQLPYRFAFGEVKTSYQKKYPPSAMFSRTGLKIQMENLRDSTRIRQDLFIYLWHRAINSDWQGKCQSAISRFLSDDTDVAIFGVMIRDVKPNKRDVAARSKSLAKNCPAKIQVKLLALYLPAKSIVGLAKFYSVKREGDHASD